MTPVVDHSAMRLGRTPSRPEDLARVPRVSTILRDADIIPTPPAEIDYLSCLTSIGMQGNDFAGDCFYAALAKLIQAQTALMGKERTFTTDEVIAMYSRDTGYVRGDTSTDNGTNMYDGLTAVVQKGFCEIELEGFGLVDGTDFAKCHEGIYIGGGLLWGVGLAQAQQVQHRWRMEIGLGDAANKPGGWGGHAVSQAHSIILPNGLSDEKVLTWGSALEVDQTFRDGGGVEEVFVAWIKGFVPPIKDFDHARFLDGIKEVRL